MKKFLHSTLAILPLAACAANAAEFPIVGGYGFDWLKPDTTRCRMITAKDTAAFKKCEFIDSGTFGLPLASHTCKAGKYSEYFILRNKAECKDALETMRANAP